MSTNQKAKQAKKKKIKATPARNQPAHHKHYTISHDIMPKFEANDDPSQEKDPCCDCQGFWYVPYPYKYVPVLMLERFLLLTIMILIDSFLS
jgi:hypothetical protein